MATILMQNFDLRNKTPNFQRDAVADKAALLSADPNGYDEGHIVYCVDNDGEGNGAHYVFNSTNELDEVTGYFRLLNNDTLESITKIDERLDILEGLTGCDCEENLNSIMGRLDALEEADAKQEGFNSNYTENFTTINNEITAIDGRLDLLEAATGCDCEENLTSINGRLTTLEATDKSHDSSIESLTSNIEELMDAVWPITINISGTQGTYRQGNSVENATYNWSATKKGETVSVDQVTINDNAVDVTANNSYTFNTAFSSPNTELQTATQTNTVKVKVGAKEKSSNFNLKFIYPKYYGFITGSDIDSVQNVVLGNTNIMEYMTSGELLVADKKQTIAINDTNSIFRWIYMYPSDLGNISSIKDGNGFSQMGDVTETTMQINDSITKKPITYKVYYSKTAASISEPASLTFA